MTNQSGSAFWTCPQCGGMGSIQDTRCPQCGTPRSAPTPPTSPQLPTITPLVGASAAIQRLASQSCPQCGAANSLFGRDCQACGASLVPVRTSYTRRSRGVAIALALFLGFVGAQYFYMGRRVLGGACVALCWTGYPLLVSILEIPRILTMSDDEFQRLCEG